MKNFSRAKRIIFQRPFLIKGALSGTVICNSCQFDGNATIVSWPFYSVNVF